ncbi:hypothetical protein INT48_001634 [Thamnidium elegans]|uniref:Autophagy-related protein 14 n=1 Tax=Thamnidium elegans TaxID=101142 RepID=A0A8H7SQ87_9FUNG|nr:hypothetical protein INT48_001634 [Thamnidium elegans]
MNCQYCHTNHRKFYCADCINEKLQKHEQEMSTCLVERDTVVTEANVFIKKATSIQTLLAEKNKRLQHLETIRETQKERSLSCITKKMHIQQLKNQIRDKRKLLEESLKRKSQFDGHHPDNNLVLKNWQRTHKMTVGTRRILVKETMSLFELKPGVIEEAESTSFLHEGKEDLYICGVTLPTRLIDVSKCPKEELNAPIGLVIHMLGLIVRYLGIKLPFEIIRRGIKPYIRAPNKQHVRKFPLFLEEDDKNFKKFIHGMSMLNYNIVYICHTQGVKIPSTDIANTLQCLMSICSAPKLGMQSHALYYQHLRDLECPIDYNQVLRATTLRFRCTSLIERSQALHEPNRSTNNELHDDFFKIRTTSVQNSINNGERILSESRDEEEFGLYVDSEEDDDDFDIKKSKGSEKQIANETWSLVEVAPFSAGHNGYEGDSLFQIGAASIMPGVMNMMESLSGSHTNQSFDRRKK